MTIPEITLGIIWSAFLVGSIAVFTTRQSKGRRH